MFLGDTVIKKTVNIGQYRSQRNPVKLGKFTAKYNLQNPFKG